MNEHSYNFAAIGKWMIALYMAQWLAIPSASRGALVTLGTLMFMDMVSGIWAGAVCGQLSSTAGMRGVSKKLGTLALLLILHYIEVRTGIELNLELAGALAYSVNEAISIVENFDRIGVPIPSKVVEALMTVKRLRVMNATPEQLRRLRTDDALDAEREAVDREHDGKC